MTRSDIPLCFAANYFDRLKGLLINPYVFS